MSKTGDILRCGEKDCKSSSKYGAKAQFRLIPDEWRSVSDCTEQLVAGATHLCDSHRLEIGRLYDSAVRLRAVDPTPPPPRLTVWTLPDSCRPCSLLY
jgi:hypothetical protein